MNGKEANQNVACQELLVRPKEGFQNA